MPVAHVVDDLLFRLRRRVAASISAARLTNASGLLISWATPAAIMPSDARRSACASCARSRARSVTSRAYASTAGLPSNSMIVDAISAVISVPSRRFAGYSRGTSISPRSFICWMRRRIVSTCARSRNVIGLPTSSPAESCPRSARGGGVRVEDDPVTRHDDAVGRMLDERAKSRPTRHHDTPISQSSGRYRA